MGREAAEVGRRRRGSDWVGTKLGQVKCEDHPNHAAYNKGGEQCGF